MSPQSIVHSDQVPCHQTHWIKDKQWRCMHQITGKQNTTETAVHAIMYFRIAFFKANFNRTTRFYNKHQNYFLFFRIHFQLLNPFILSWFDFHNHNSHQYSGNVYVSTEEILVFMAFQLKTFINPHVVHHPRQTTSKIAPQHDLRRIRTQNKSLTDLSQ